MKQGTLNDQLFEVMLEHAVHENCETYIASLYSGEEQKHSRAYEPTEKFEKNMQKLIVKSKRIQVLHHLPAVIKKVAAVFLFIFGLASFSLMSMPPVYAAIKEVTMRWLPQFSSYEYKISATDIKNAEWEFTYIPKGYKLLETHLVAEAKYSIYANEEGEVISIDIDKRSSAPKIYIDNENSVYSQMQIDGVTAELYAANSEEEISHLIWTNGGYTFYISGSLHKDELIKMAEAVKIKR